METKILKVVRQGEAFNVPSKTTESGVIQKCNIVLKELGSSKYENEYVVALLGNAAALEFYEQDVVVAKLSFQTHEYNDQVYQDVMAKEIIRVKN